MGSKIGFLCLLVTLAGCTTAEEYRRADGGKNVQIACGAAVGWNICLNRAREECPAGFDVVARGNDGNRKEMTIECGAATPPAVSNEVRASASCRLRVAESPVRLSEVESAARVRDCILAAGYQPPI